MTQRPDIRVVIVDDHEVVREAISRMIDRHMGFEIVGQAGRPEFVEAAVNESRPDVVLMDMWLGSSAAEPEGIELTRRLAEVYPTTKVVAFTGDSDPTLLTRFLAAGGAGFVGKTASAADLLRAIEAASAGGTPILATFSSRATRIARRPVSLADERLSGREVEVIKRIAAGLSSKEIGAELSISSTTVDTYRRRIAAKLGSGNRATLVRYALEHGLLD